MSALQHPPVATVCHAPDEACWSPDVRWASSVCVGYATVAAGGFRYVRLPPKSLARGLFEKRT